MLKQLYLVRTLTILCNISHLDTVEDGFLSIFDVPKDNTLVENNVNINDTVIGYSDSNTSTSISDNMIELNSLQTYEFDYSSSG